MTEVRTPDDLLADKFDNIEQIDGDSLVSARKARLEAERAREERLEEYSFTSRVVDVMRQDFIVTQTMDALMDDFEEEAEEDFLLFDPKHKELYADLSPESQEALLTDPYISSRAGIEHRAVNLREREAREARMADLGMGGVAGRLALNVFDPAYILAEMAVGHGAITAGMLAKNGNAARRAVEAAAIGLTSEAAIGAGRMGLDDQYDVGDYARDVAFAVVGNTVLGAAGGALERRGHMDTMMKKQKLARVTELVTEIDKRVEANPELDEDELLDSILETEEYSDLKPLMEVNEDGDYDLQGSVLRLWDSRSAHGNSDSATERMLAARVLEDAVGSRGSKVINHHTASREAVRLDDKWGGAQDRVLWKNMNSYMAATGRSKFSINNWDEAHAELGEQLTRYITDHHYVPMNDETDRIVREIADVMRRNYEDVLLDSQRSGVKAADGLSPDKNYTPRVWDRKQIREMVRNNIISQQQLVKVFREALQGAEDSAFSNMEGDDFYDMWAEAVAARFVGRQMGGKNDFSPNGDDWSDLMEEDFDEMAAAVMEKMKGTEGGNANVNSSANPENNFKRKMSLNFDTYVRDDNGMIMKTANGEDMTLFDLLQKNALMNSTVYYRRQAGNVALHKVGIQGKNQFDTLVQQAMNESATPQVVKERTDKMYRQITGQPTMPEYQQSKMARGLKLATKYNFVTGSGRMFFAAFNEASQSLSRNGLMTTINRLPDMIRITGMRRNVNNNVEAIEEFTDAIGGMNHGPYRNMFNDFSDTGIIGFEDKLAKVEQIAKRGERAMARVNALPAVDQAMRELSFMTSLDSFAKAAQTGDLKRLPFSPNELGLSEEMLGKIMKYAKNSMELSDGIVGKKVNRMNFDKWVDADGHIDYAAREAFGRAMHRANTKMVQRVTPGETAYLTDNPLFNVFFQFRNFALNAVTKHLARDLSNLNDIKTFTAMMYGSLMAYMTYNARVMSQAVGREDQEAFLRQRFVTPADFGRAVSGDTEAQKRVASALRYVPTIGAGYDMLSVPAGFAGIQLPGAFRSTGITNTMASLDANPTTKNLQSLFTGMKAGLDPNDQQTERERRALLMLTPFSSLTGVENLITRIAQETAPIQ